MLPSHLDSVTAKYLEDLCNNRTPETQTLEFKSELPGRDAKAKNEFLKDVSAIANAQGGDLIYGVQEAESCTSALAPITAESYAIRATRRCPPEEEWLANITNLKTRLAYKEDVREFIGFTGLNDYMGLRSVVRSHIISWRKDMERRGLAPSSIRRKLSALSWLFDYLCERNAVAGNPVDGVNAQ